MSSAKAAPANALFTKTQQRVLGLIYGNPEQSFYANEVVRSANMGRGTVRRELERLASAGLLNVTKAGNQLHYQANSDNPIYEDLVSIIRKTSALVDVLSSSLKPIEQQIQLAFVYDSIPKARQN
ncbi:MAG: winged helix-turn-helix domain-containing protein, partial [Gammaproteobacteria bacterium]|nr:winged helix-turn-helix domain-containing protein [Gammaproteobacteria bacterium]